MTRRRSCPRTPELFNWTPPDPVVSFAPERVRAASLANELSRVISETLSECSDDRNFVAARMSAFLGQDVSINMLDKYASEAAEDHIMNLVRFVAFLHVTNDRRPLQHIAAMFGWMVIPDDYREVIELAQEQEAQRLQERRIRQLRQSAKKKGVL